MLIRRKKWPYQDYWAIPGGFIQMGESLDQSVLRERLDKRNFRRKILATGVLEETGTCRNGGMRRPARLYRFTAAAIELEQARRCFP